jgi:hypothetical protein
MTCFKKSCRLTAFGEKTQAWYKHQAWYMLIHALKNSFRINPPVSFIFTKKLFLLKCLPDSYVF